MSADSDMAKAVKDKWDANLTLTSNITGGLYVGRAASPKTLPYAKLMSEQGPTANDYSTCPSYIDYRKVMIDIYGLGHAAVGALLKLVMNAFDNSTITVPNATFGRILLLRDVLIQDETTKDGEDIWIGRAEFEVMTTRSNP